MPHPVALHVGASLKPILVAAVAAFAIVGCVPLAMAGKMAFDLATFEPPAGDCEDHPLAPFTDDDRSLIQGSVILHLTNQGDGATARVCLFDGSGTKRVDLAVPMAAGASRDIVVETPPGVYTYRTEARYPHPERAIGSTGQGTLNTNLCLTHTEDITMTFHVGPTGSGGAVHGGGCVLPASLAVGVLGVLGSGAAFLLGKFPHLGAALLYSRLAKPRVLDQDVRARMIELVGREPGIHTRELARALDVGDGQVAYHLGVLSREKHLVSIGLPGMRHWFVAGRFTPSQARAHATLRDPTRRRVYDEVKATPGASLSDIAGRANVSLSQGSRAAAALEKVGLVERRRVGKLLQLVPRGTAAA